MVCYDGYLLSHTYMPFEVPEEKKVARFLKPFKPAYALDPANPANLNTVTLPDVRMDVKARWPTATWRSAICSRKTCEAP